MSQFAIPFRGADDSCKRKVSWEEAIRGASQAAGSGRTSTVKSKAMEYVYTSPGQEEEGFNCDSFGKKEMHSHYTREKFVKLFMNWEWKVQSTICKEGKTNHS